MNFEMVEHVDPQVAKAMKLELNRQRNNIELIASENFVSKAVLEAMGSPLTNKYAEGYPGRRYYGGCEYVDIVEDLARDRLKELFGAEHANVQPHSGAQANMAVYYSVLEPGDKVLGMSLPHGGHLTHGSPVNISGNYFNFISYEVNKETERIDYSQLEELAIQEKPKMIVAGASAYSRVIDFERIGEIARKIDAYFMVDMAHIAGLVAAGLHPNPVPYADFITSTTHKTLRGPRGGIILCKREFAKDIDKGIFPGTQGGPLMHTIAAKAVSFQEALQPEFKEYQKQIVRNAKALGASLIQQGFRLVSGGTDNHLILMDLRNMNITGREAEKRLDEVGVTVNKNTIPFETESPFVTSGIRIGTPAVTSRGMQEKDMEIIAQIIKITLGQGESGYSEARDLVHQLCKKYPLY